MIEFILYAIYGSLLLDIWKKVFKYLLRLIGIIVTIYLFTTFYIN